MKTEAIFIWLRRFGVSESDVDLARHRFDIGSITFVHSASEILLTFSGHNNEKEVRELITVLMKRICRKQLTTPHKSLTH